MSPKELAQFLAEKEAEKERNTQDIVKLLDKKKLLEIPLSVWKNNLKDISDLLNS